MERSPETMPHHSKAVIKGEFKVSNSTTTYGRFYEIDGRSYPSVTNILNIIGKPALINWAAKVEREMVIKVSSELYQNTPMGVPHMTPAAWTITLNNRLGKEKAMAKELAKASEIGTQVHDLIEWTLKGELCYDAGPSPRISDKAQWAFMAWEDWRRSVKLKPLYVEQVVYSQGYGYAGTLDLLCEIKLSELISYFIKKSQEVPQELTALSKKQVSALTVCDWKTGKAVYPEAYLQNAAYRQAWREMGQGNPELGLIVRLPKVETDPEFEVVVAPPEVYSFEKFRAAYSLWTWQQAYEAYQDRHKKDKP
jgi:hypothetical protein